MYRMILVSGHNGTIAINLPPAYQQSSFSSDSIMNNDATKKVLSVSINTKKDENVTHADVSFFSFIQKKNPTLFIFILIWALSAILLLYLLDNRNNQS